MNKKIKTIKIVLILLIVAMFGGVLLFLINGAPILFILIGLSNFKREQERMLV